MENRGPRQPARTAMVTAQTTKIARPTSGAVGARTAASCASSAKPLNEAYIVTERMTFYHLPVLCSTCRSYVYWHVHQRMKKFLATLAVLVVPVAATAPQAFAASSNLWGGALHWSNTYKFVNPPSSWLSTSWKGFGISVPADATVTANAKVLEVSIPSSQEPLVVRFRTHSVPRTVKISRDGGMQVTHGSVSAIDKIDEFDAFLEALRST